MLLCRRIISGRDQRELAGAVELAGKCWSTYAPHLEFFGSEVRRARAVPPEQVPSDMVTMNSRFVLCDDHTGHTIAYTLVYPNQEAPQEGRLSVLTPLGMAVFGARVGDEICWQSSAGPEVATIQRLLYQPEAAGHHHL